MCEQGNFFLKVLVFPLLQMIHFPNGFILLRVFFLIQFPFTYLQMTVSTYIFRQKKAGIINSTIVFFF